MPDRISQNLARVRERIASACARRARDPLSVRLVAVTKEVGLAEARALVGLGVTDLGENRVELALPKMDEMSRDSAAGGAGGAGAVAWHMIGHIQSRKARLAVGRFAMIHSVDSVKLLEELDKRAAAAGTTETILAEVSVSGEEGKFGLRPADARGFCEAASACRHVKLRGLMTMAPLVEDPEKARPVFAGLRSLLEELNSSGAYPERLTELSMGMTNDFEVAVEEGATIVRIGTALFR